MSCAFDNDNSKPCAKANIVPGIMPMPDDKVANENLGFQSKDQYQLSTKKFQKNLKLNL